MLLHLLCAAHATVGGPQWLEVLGVLPDEHKLFLLSHAGGESGELPQLLYYRFDEAPEEQRPDRPVAVRSWYQGDVRKAEEAFPGRLEGLKKTLKPLQQAPLRGIELTLTWGESAPCPKAHEDAQPCHRVEAKVQWEGQQAATTLNTWGDIELAGAWTVPGTERRLVVLRHTGITFETGYAAEVPLLLEAQSTDSTRAP